MKLKSIVTSKSANTLAFFNILGPLILNGVYFFTIPIFTRALGPASYGVVAIFTTWVQFFTVIVGLQTSGSIATSMVYFEEDERDKYRSSVMTLSAVALAVTTAVVAVFIGPISGFMKLSPFVVFLSIAQAFGAFCLGFMNIVLTYEKRAFLNFVLSVLTTVATVVLSIVLIFTVFRGERNYLGRILGMAIPNILMGVLLFLYFIRRGRTGYDARYWRFCLPLVVPLIFHGLSQIVLSQTSKVVIQQTLDETTVGIYSLVVTVANILVILYNALNNTWVPFYYEYLKSGDHDKLRRRTRNYLFLFTILVMGFILVSPEVVVIFAGEKFAKGVDLLPVLAVGSYMTYLYSFSVNYQFFHRRTVNIATGTVLAAAVNIGLNLLLIPRIGMMGAAIATAVSYAALFLFHECIARFVIRGDYPYGWTTYLVSMLCVAASYGLLVIFSGSMLIRWTLGIILGAVLVGRIVKTRTIF